MRWSLAELRWDLDDDGVESKDLGIWVSPRVSLGSFLLSSMKGCVNVGDLFLWCCPGLGNDVWEIMAGSVEVGAVQKTRK
jgi:hypothetical protein